MNNSYSKQKPAFTFKIIPRFVIQSVSNLLCCCDWQLDWLIRLLTKLTGLYCIINSTMGWVESDDSSITFLAQATTLTCSLTALYNLCSLPCAAETKFNALTMVIHKSRHNGSSCKWVTYLVLLCGFRLVPWLGVAIAIPTTTYILKLKV
jgi:hypothetical protein